MTFGILPIAEFLAHSQRAELALELVEHFKAPSKSWLTGYDEVHETIAQLKADLSPELAVAACEHSQNRNFSSLVDEIIAGLQDLD